MTIVCYGQSVYMHEAQQDAEESGATGIQGIVTMVIFFGAIYIISAIWPSKKDKHNNNSSSFTDEADENMYWEEKEKAEQYAEMDLLDSLNDKKDTPTASDNLDYSPIEISAEELFSAREREQKHKEFVAKFIKQQEDKSFPEGSIKEKLKSLSREPLVDLGLSVKWCSKNIGALDIYDLGYRFRWGSLNHIDNYDKEKSSEYYYMPYDENVDKLDEDISGKENYDAATKLSGGEFRTPTKAECEELMEKCNWEYLEVDKYKGFIITGPSKNSIFLPLSYSSFINCMYLVMMTVEEAYMTSTPEMSSKPTLEKIYGFEGYAYKMKIINSNHRTDKFTRRIDSFGKRGLSPIRGVCK